MYATCPPPLTPWQVKILLSCQHAHLMPLLAYYLELAVPWPRLPAVPLMVGGSLQTRLDLKPLDIAYLRAMGHHSAPPKPLTWRQRVRAIAQALEALVYLHALTPRILHRDFKPATRDTRSRRHEICAARVSRRHGLRKGGAAQRRGVAAAWRNDRPRNGLARLRTQGCDNGAVLGND